MLGRHRVVAHFLAQFLAEQDGHLRAGQVLAGDADGLAEQIESFPEYAEGALADVFGGDAGELTFAHRQREFERAVRTLLRPHAHVDQVVPVERIQHERGRHSKLGKRLVGLALGVELRHLELAHECRHMVVRERYQLACVLAGGPDGVLEAGLLRRLGEGHGMQHFLFGIEVLGEKSDAERAVAAVERHPQARPDVEVGLDHFRAQFGQFPRFFGLRVAGQRPHREAGALFGQDGADQSAPLQAGGANHGDFLAFGHVGTFWKWAAPERHPRRL